MAVTVSNSNIAKFNTEVELVKNAATETVVDTAELFTITPDTADYKSVMIIENGAGAGALAFSIAAGDQYGAESPLTGSVADGESAVIEVEAGKYLNDGDFELTLTPAAGQALLTNHAASVSFVGTK